VNGEQNDDDDDDDGDDDEKAMDHATEQGCAERYIERAIASACRFAAVLW
jgi:hypothetical protein